MTECPSALLNLSLAINSYKCSEEGEGRGEGSLQMSCQEKYQVHMQEFCKSSCSVRTVTHKSFAFLFQHSSIILSLTPWKGTSSFKSLHGTFIEPWIQPYNLFQTASTEVTLVAGVVHEANSWPSGTKHSVFLQICIFRKNSMLYWKSVVSQKSASDS